MAKLCFKFKVARRLGIAVYTPSPWNSLKEALKKWFLESFFDLVFITCLYIYEVLQSNISFGIFFSTFDDSFCTILAICILIMLLLFSIWAIWGLWKMSKEPYNESLKERFTVLFEELKSHTSFYPIIFIIRRMLTSVCLVQMHKYPFFASNLLVVMSIFNLSYLLDRKPYCTKTNNINEILNELCIYCCALIYSQFLNVGLPAFILNGFGWVYIGIVCLNIIGNFFYSASESFFNFCSSIKDFYQEWRASVKVNKAIANREKLIEAFPEAFGSCKN